MKHQTLKLLWVLIEIAASARAAVATYAVVMNVSGGDMVFSVFTVAVVEVAFLVSLFSIGLEASAPIAAFLALAFSAGMQYLEVVTLSGALSENDKFVLRSVVAFAPIVILGLAYVRRVVTETDVRGAIQTIGSKISVTRPPVEALPGDSGRDGVKQLDAEIEPLRAARIRKCSECGGEFEYRNAKQVTCSNKCRVARSRRLSGSNSQGN